MPKFSEKISELEQGLQTSDVGQKRYMMNTIFDRALEHRLSEEEDEFHHLERVEKLKDIDGYLYKLAQEFLTSSSTFEKQKKLEQIIEHVD